MPMVPTSHENENSISALKRLCTSGLWDIFYHKQLSLLSATKVEIIQVRQGSTGVHGNAIRQRVFAESAVPLSEDLSIPPFLQRQQSGIEDSVV